MNLTLYHYVHCPFCLRVRMALGYLHLPFKSIVLPYDDEETPLKLTGVKMLPILDIDGVPLNESLDIIAKIDQDNVFHTNYLTNSTEFHRFNDLLGQLGKNVHNLAMPYWIWTPEFTSSSRAYFQNKKEKKRGPFKDLVKKSEIFISELHNDLENLSKDLKPFYASSTFSLYDILLASHLWGLYIVPEFQFPERIHAYLQEVKRLCGFQYHKDFWR